MKENQLASVISMDFQKAFDSVSPQILPQVYVVTRWTGLLIT